MADEAVVVMGDEDPGQQGVGVDMARVNVTQLNGEWIEAAHVPKLGETMKLEVTVYVNKVGQEMIEDGGRRQFVGMKTTGVNVIG